MKKAIVYGTGWFYKKNKERFFKDIEIIAFADSRVESSTTVSGKMFEDKRILAPNEIKNEIFDIVYICTEAYNANPIFRTLINNGVGADKIEFLWKRNAIDGEWRDYPSEENDGIISNINGIKIKQRYHTDFDFVPEVFFYNTYYLDLAYDKYIVIDVGMNIGIASLFFASREEVEKVYGFEPFRDTYNQAIENFQRNTLNIRNKIEAYNIGLLDKNEEKEVAISAEESGYRDIFTFPTEENHTKIVCKIAGEEINSIIKNHNGTKIVLKIDTEGSEYLIFKSLNEYGCFDKIDAILLEYHDGADELIKILRDNSYKVILHGQKNKLGMLYAIK